jgi:hypothetical protein
MPEQTGLPFGYKHLEGLPPFAYRLIGRVLQILVLIVAYFLFAIIMDDLPNIAMTVYDCVTRRNRWRDRHLSTGGESTGCLTTV